MRKFKLFSKDISSFLEASRSFLKPPSLTDTVNDKPGSSRTNIIFLTTRCNFDCEYCYEKDKREQLDYQKDITVAEIDTFLKEIAEREKGINTG